MRGLWRGIVAILAPKAETSPATFRFEPRWKEELVVTGPGGVFVLELPMGILSAYLPTEEAWPKLAPLWALDLWPTLKTELEAWCVANKAILHIDETAGVFPASGICFPMVRPV